MQNKNTIEIDLSHVSFWVLDLAKFHYLEWCYNAWNYIKLRQFLDDVARDFSYTRNWKITAFYKMV